MVDSQPLEQPNQGGNLVTTVTTKTFEYDAAGRVIKETVTVEDVVPTPPLVLNFAGKVDKAFAQDVIRSIRRAERASGKKLL